MMKRLTLLFAAIVLAACSGTDVPERPVEICIDASVGSLTRVSYSGDATGFDAGDRIAVYAWTGSASEVPAERVVDGVANTLDSQGKWVPEAQMLWKTVADPHYFLGVHPLPAARIADFSAVAYTLDPSDYTASDLILAANLDGLKAADGPVPLMFSHALAKLNVNLTFRDVWDTTPAVSSVTTKAKGSAIVNYLTGDISAIGDASAVDIPASPQAASGYALSFSGLQVPQAGVKTITVRIGGQNYLYESATDIPLKSGRLTTLSLIVSKDIIRLASATVTDWEDGTVLPQAEATMPPQSINGHEYVEMGDGLKWATCNVGADKPWESGLYLAWAETEEKSMYYVEYYKYDVGYFPNQYDAWIYAFTKYCHANRPDVWGGTGSPDNKMELDPEDDAARKYWKGTWRMPTGEEWRRLENTDNYTHVWTQSYNGTGVHGTVVISKVPGYEGNMIFLPAVHYYPVKIDYIYSDRQVTGVSGRYWSSSLHPEEPRMAQCMEIGENHMQYFICRLGAFYRDSGLAIRAVSE